MTFFVHFITQLCGTIASKSTGTCSILFENGLRSNRMLIISTMFSALLLSEREGITRPSAKRTLDTLTERSVVMARLPALFGAIFKVVILEQWKAAMEILQALI
jgi:hypothetical protein